MALFVLRKLILQTRMRSYTVGLDAWFLVWPFEYFHTPCVRTAMALARLRGCAGLPEPSLVAYVIITIISWADSNRHMSQFMRKENLSHRRLAMVQTSLYIGAVSPELSLFHGFGKESQTARKWVKQWGTRRGIRQNTSHRSAGPAEWLRMLG